MNLPVPDVYLYREVFRSSATTGSRQLAILPDLMLLADLRAKGADAIAFSRELLVNLRSLPAFARLDRVSISQLAPGSNMLFVLGSAQGLNCKPENRICDPPAACGVARSSKWREPFHRIVRLAAGLQLRFSAHQMGGQERQPKMDKIRRSGGFTNSTAFSRVNPTIFPTGIIASSPMAAL